ncbi:MAG: hypothetical protein NW215_02605 [Hyphomicrobiales bacterium]|nr:hypothetical protein [Hyphomicrobiales bacterium]
MKASVSSNQPTPPIMEKTVGEALSEAKHAAETCPDDLPGLQNFGFDALSALFEAEDDGVWPKTVKEFNDAGYLEPGDIVLMTKLGSMFSWFVNVFDKSDFAHCAMVFQTPHDGHGIDHTFLIETSMGGVDLQTLTEIVAPTKVYKDVRLPPDFVVGVKRLEAPWASKPLRRMAANRMLHFIDNDDYDFSMLMALATRTTSKLYFRLLPRLRGAAPTVSEYLTKGVKFSPAEFICSGFVQFAYVDMVKTAIERGLIKGPDVDAAWSDVMFADAIGEATSMKKLMAVTPRQLARTRKLKWKYFINRGKVYRADSCEDVNKYFDEIRARHRRLVEA